MRSGEIVRSVLAKASHRPGGVTDKYHADLWSIEHLVGYRANDRAVRVGIASFDFIHLLLEHRSAAKISSSMRLTRSYF